MIEIFWASKMIRAAHKGDLATLDSYAEHWAKHCDEKGDAKSAEILRSAVTGETGRVYKICEGEKHG